MPIDWEFNYKLNEVWHSIFRPYFAKRLTKYLIFLDRKTGGLILSENIPILCGFSIVTWSKRGAQQKNVTPNKLNI